MLDPALVAICILGVVLLFYARFRPVNWYPILRAVSLRIFVLIAASIALWKIALAASYAGVLADALVRTPGAQLKDYSASIQGLTQILHLHNLGLFAAAMAAGVAADLRPTFQTRQGAASA